MWLLHLERQCSMAFFVSAASPLEFDRQLAALDAKSLLNVYGNAEPPTELETRKTRVIDALRINIGRWVMILDNADSKKVRAEIMQLFKDLAGGRFIVTSRREDWPKASVRKLRLGVFSLNEAVNCLLSRYWKSEPSAAELADFEQLAEELGRLPLALTLAASYMESHAFSPKRYLAKWREKDATLLDFDAEGVEHDRSLQAAFKVSYDQLSIHGTALLRQLAWLAPQPFPRVLIEESMVFRQIVTEDASERLAELKALSLIELDDKSLSLHRLVIACARALMSEEQQGAAFLAALGWIAATLPQVKYDKAGWELWMRLSPHLEGVIETNKRLKIDGQPLVTICQKYGRWLFDQARFGPAEPLMRRALAIDENSYGTAHPRVATDLTNLAGLLQATERFTEAEPLMRRALAIDENSYGTTHPRVATDLNNLAGVLKATGRLAEAEALMKRALAIDERSYGVHHPNVAIDLNNLAQLLKATNRLAEAEPLMRRALAIDEQTYGGQHPAVAIRLNNLAQWLKATDRLAEAESLMRRALAIDEITYGMEHPNVAMDLNNLAQVLKTTKRLAEAETLLALSLTILLKFALLTGDLHPHLKGVFLNYGALLAEAALENDEISQRVRAVGMTAGFDAAAYQRVLDRLFK